VVYWSPGDFLLSIHKSKGAFGEATAGVESQVKSRESWLTPLAGTLFLLEGCKGLIRWSMWAPSPPLFGLTFSESAGVAVSMAFGLVECLIAYWIFQVNRAAVLVGTSYLLLMVVSTWMSWDLWPDWAAESIRRRREYQGRMVTADELAFARRSARHLALGSALGYLMLLVLASPRLLRKRRVQASEAPAALPTVPR
jgi:hypothetical protein